MKNLLENSENHLRKDDVEKKKSKTKENTDTKKEASPEKKVEPIGNGSY